MNTPTIQQAGAIVSEIYKQVSGQKNLASINNLGDYISVASTTLTYGLDKVFNALTEMWGRTIFAVRPYRGILRDMDMEASRWGIADRKISFASRLPGTNAAYEYPVTYSGTQDPPTGDGLSVDMYKINKDKPVQTVFYGQSTYSFTRTRFLRQLDTAFRDPEELLRYNAAALQALSNDREMWAESMRRGLLLNAAGAVNDENAGRVIHLGTEYLALNPSITRAELVTTGLADFVRWAFARIAQVFDEMASLNTSYTMQLDSLTNNDMAVLRHTPRERLKIKMASQVANQIRAIVYSTTYHDNYLEDILGAPVEEVPYWQSPEDPLAVSVTPTYLDRSGHTINGEPTAISNMAIIAYDEDALGCTAIRSSQYTTPFNTEGEYWNDSYKEVYKTRFDNTEKIVVFTFN